MPSSRRWTYRSMSCPAIMMSATSPWTGPRRAWCGRNSCRCGRRISDRSTRHSVTMACGSSCSTRRSSIPGLALEGEQREWLERELEDSAGGRVMLFMHYPPYLGSPDEDESYDNLAEPGRSWIMGLVERHQIEALFAGHVHHFWYHRHASTDCYLLPSTSFTRQGLQRDVPLSAGARDGGRSQRHRQGGLLRGAGLRAGPCLPLPAHWRGRAGTGAAPGDEPSRIGGHCAAPPRNDAVSGGIRHASSLGRADRHRAVRRPGRVSPQARAKRLSAAGPVGNGGRIDAYPRGGPRGRPAGCPHAGPAGFGP